MRILLIEDEADLLTSLAKALREEGHAVDTAADGEEGLYKAREVAYHQQTGGGEHLPFAPAAGMKFHSTPPRFSGRIYRYDIPSPH